MAVDTTRDRRGLVHTGGGSRAQDTAAAKRRAEVSRRGARKSTHEPAEGVDGFRL